MMKKIIIASLLIALICSFSITQEGDYEVQQEESQQINSGVTAYTAYNESTGLKFAAFTQAAYCENKKIKKWKCGNPCKDYEGMQEVTVIESADKVNKGFVGFYEPDNAIVISWKGTIKISQWLEDFNYEKTSYPYCSGCEVHRGFWEGWEGLQSYFWVAFNKLRTAHPNAQIYLTGHSLGAALSVFCAMNMIQEGITDFVWYNFGQPRVGNAALAQYVIDNFPSGLKRVTHHRDPVPHVPPEDFGFRHTTQEIFYVDGSSPNAKHIICSATNGEDPDCSDQYVFDLDVNDHVWYEGYDYVYNIGLCMV